MFLIIFLNFFSNDSAINDNFIKIVTDKTWPEIQKKSKNIFLFFHASHQRVSDMGYLRFIEIAQKYQNLTTFYVIPGSFGDQTARQFRIGGFPSLFYLSSETIINEMYGPFSFDNIERFIKNQLSKGFQDLEINENFTYNNLISNCFRDEFEMDSTIFLFSDESTRFGRISIQFAKEFSNNFRFIRIKNENFIKKLGFRFPSIHLFRIDDHEEFNYIGEPNIKSILEWINQLPNPKIKEFDQNSLFSIDGNLIKTIIYFNNNLNNLKKINFLNNIKYFYSNSINIKPLLNYFNLSLNLSKIYIQSNYTHISINENNFNNNFLFTPSQLYDNIALISQSSFENMINFNPLFVLFTKPNCPRCDDLYQFTLPAAYHFNQKNKSIRWTIWDIQKNIPNYLNKLNLNLPSLYYIPNKNFSNIIEFKGQKEDKQILQWALSMIEEKNEFNLL